FEELSSPVPEDPRVEEIINEDPIREEIVDETPDPLAVVELPPLNNEVLNILGDDTSKAKHLGGKVFLYLDYTGIFVPAWCKKYPPATNCPRIAPPRIKPRNKSAVSDSTIRRDKRLTEFQDQIGATLSALGKALTVLLGEERKGSNLHLIELISDVGRIMADLHHTQSESRRVLVGQSLNKNFKDTLVDTSLDGWLFGDNLGDRVKTAKALERSGQDLKIPQPKQKQVALRTNQTLNSKSPSRQYKKPRLDGQRYQPRAKPVQQRHRQPNQTQRYQGDKPWRKPR
ncbi:hypothetical protein NQ317_011138, partial [Molorchus minor]